MLDPVILKDGTYIIQANNNPYIAQKGFKKESEKNVGTVINGYYGKHQWSSGTLATYSRHLQMIERIGCIAAVCFAALFSLGAVFAFECSSNRMKQLWHQGRTGDSRVNCVLVSGNGEKISPAHFKKTMQEVEEAHTACQGTFASPADKQAAIERLKVAYYQLWVIYKESPENRWIWAQNGSWQPIYHYEKGKIPDEILPEASRLFYLYGQYTWGGDMPGTLLLFKMALAIRFISLDLLQKNALPSMAQRRLECASSHLEIIDRDHFKEDEDTLDAPWRVDHRDQLDKLDNVLRRNHRYGDMDMRKEMQEEDFIKTICDQGPEEAIKTAMMIKSVADTYQNINQYQKPEHRQLFEKIFGLARKIFEKVDTKESRWELARLVYGSGRFMSYLELPEGAKKTLQDVKKALATLDKVNQALAAEGNSGRAQQMRAQICNIKNIELSQVPPEDKNDKRAWLAERLENVKKAYEIAEQTQKFDPFLKTMFLNNKAKVAMECIEFDKTSGLPMVFEGYVKDIDQWTAEVCSTIEKEKYNHYYHSAFVITRARFELLEVPGVKEANKEKAAAALDLAETICKKYPASSQDILKTINDLRPKTR